MMVICPSKGTDADAVANDVPDEDPELDVYDDGEPDKPESIGELLTSEREGSVVGEMAPWDVRWFYKRRPNHKSWRPLTAWDSFKTERQYRSYLKTLKRKNASQSSNKSNTSEKVAPKDRATILNEYYFVDFEQMIAKPIYWESKATKILRRGVWFLCSKNWQPLDASVADEIEKRHVRKFKGQTVPPVQKKSSKKKGVDQILNIKTAIGEIVWYDIDQVFLMKRRTGLSRFLIRSTSERLHRGYHTPASEADEPEPTRHLVLVIHGIGQKKYCGRIYRNAAEMRMVFKQIRRKKFGNKIPMIMFLGIEWRTKLNLCDENIDLITLPRISTVRSFVNEIGLDLLYYVSPRYQTEICSGLAAELARRFQLFMDHNPSFLADGGQVSLVGHSLGSVIMYDLISGWKITGACGSQQNLCKVIKRSKRKQKAIMKTASATLLAPPVDAALQAAPQPCLPFSIHKLFMLGSPMGVFLLLRDLKNKPLLKNRRLCSRVYNIIHPTDPVAYRVEPILEGYSSMTTPQLITKCNTKVKAPKQSESNSNITGSKKNLRDKLIKKDSSYDSDSDADNDIQNVSTKENRIQALARGIGFRRIKSDPALGKNVTKLRKSQIDLLSLVSHDSNASKTNIRSPAVPLRSTPTKTNIARKREFLERVDFILPPGSRWWNAHFAYFVNPHCMLFIIESLLGQSSAIVPFFDSNEDEGDHNDLASI